VHKTIITHKGVNIMIEIGDAVRLTRCNTRGGMLVRLGGGVVMSRRGAEHAGLVRDGIVNSAGLDSALDLLTGGNRAK